MLKRCIVCPSNDSAKLLRAWLPRHIVTSSKFYVSDSQSLAASNAQALLGSCPAQLLLIRNAYTYHEETILDLEGESEDALSLYSSSRRFEVEVVAPALESMLFETPKIFEAVFREMATQRLHLIGFYEPDRAIREAGLTMREIVASADEVTRDLMRETSIAQRILARIAKLDAKPFTYVDGEDHAWHSRSPPFTAGQ
ncbi:hypothetical protein PCA31118_01494 [Pandoraea captiosa]|uniref:Uncharacterized protein n=1 Tax=Pandoraea captiosa TaxID=2508302 RepID=A0A5E4ZTI5_9BURK|nr:hypothetical protein [Pandoraea captiosa]VVE64107.1 hypothetical protein PCA31118_01494 [Pandoraea captiosa]